MHNPIKLSRSDIDEIYQRGIRRIMAEIWKPQPKEVIYQWINDILNEAEDKLTDWERTFITEIEIRIANGWSITEAQQKKLEQIYAEKTN